MNGVRRGDLAHDRVAGLLDPVDLPAERGGDHRDRGGEADVADHVAALQPGLERSGGEAHALGPQHGRAVRREIVAATDEDRCHLGADVRQRHRQQIHHEARVDAGADHGHLSGHGEFVHPLRPLGRVRGRPHHLLGDRHDVHAAFDADLQFGGRVGQRGAGGLDHRVGPDAREHRVEVVLHLDTDRFVHTRNQAGIVPGSLGPLGHDTDEGQIGISDNVSDDG